eukprot:scaffold387_cov244-Pinguiococcus_pyrenoidosus.AAC.7
MCRLSGVEHYGHILPDQRDPSFLSQYAILSVEDALCGLKSLGNEKVPNAGKPKSFDDEASSVFATCRFPPRERSRGPSCAAPASLSTSVGVLS